MGKHAKSESAEQLARCIALAAEAHGSQTDRSGEPYILHPLRVMLACKSLEARCAAVLHDVVEDTPVTLSELHRAHKIPLDIVAAVGALTHDTDEPYSSYIIRCASNRIAREVKRADLWDNYLNPERQAMLRPALVERYTSAMKYLDSIEAAEQATRSVVPSPTPPPQAVPAALRVCFYPDPDKMHGAADGFGGTDDPTTDWPPRGE